MEISRFLFTFTISAILNLSIIVFVMLNLKPLNEFIKFGRHESCDATIVTAYYMIRSKHSHEEYLAWMSNMLTLTDCMVIFTQEELSGYNHPEVYSEL